MNVCPECGGELDSQIDGSCLTISCLSCDWSVATTYTEPIYEDQTVYAISILPGNPVSKPVLLAIGKLVEVNFLGAKPIAEQGCERVYEDTAPEVREKKLLLDEAGVAYRIEPEFPY